MCACFLTSSVEIQRRLRQFIGVNFLKYLAPVGVALLLVGCHKAVSSPSKSGTNWSNSFGDNEPTHAQPRLPTIKLYMGPDVVEAEMATTLKEIQTGMMFRTNIPESDTMIFVLPYPQRAAFWMKNCPVSLSAAYITPDGLIAEIHHLEHDDTNTVFSSVSNIQFVLETKAGWFKRHHIGVGTLIRTEKGSLVQTFLHQP